MPAAPKTLTVRLPRELYETARATARRRDTSLNGLVQDALQAMARQEEEAQLLASFDVLSEDAKEADVEFASAAQREVVLSEKARRPHRRQSRKKSKPRTR